MYTLILEIVAKSVAHENSHRLLIYWAYRQVAASVFKQLSQEIDLSHSPDTRKSHPKIICYFLKHEIFIKLLHLFEGQPDLKKFKKKFMPIFLGQKIILIFVSQGNL